MQTTTITDLTIDAPPEEPPWISAYTFYFQKYKSVAYILLLTICVYLHSNFSGGLQKTILFLQEWRFGHSRSSKVVDFGANKKRICDFLLVHHSNLGPIFHRFGDIAGFCASDPTPIPPQLSYSAVKLFSKNSNLYDHGT